MHVMAALALVLLNSSPPPREMFEAHEWRDAARQSSCVVSGVVTEPWVWIIRPERHEEKTVIAADGSVRYLSPQMDEYLEGGVARIQVDEVYRSDGTVSANQTVEIFWGGTEPLSLEVGQRYLFFLRRPFDTAGQIMEGGERHWSSLRGTVAYRPGHFETPQTFDPAQAYGFAPGVTPWVLAFTTKNRAQIALAISQAELPDDVDPSGARCIGAEEWECTAEGPGGCRRPGTDAISRPHRAHGANVESDPSSPAEKCTEWATGYVTTFATGPWSDCTARCGGGVKLRLVNATSWSTWDVNAAIPTNRETCNVQACE
jgi:hypothetical protein